MKQQLSNQSNNHSSNTPLNPSSSLQSQFSQFLTMFQSFVKDNHKKIEEFRPKQTYQVQARDRQVIISLPQIPSTSNRKIQPSNLKKWIADIFTNVFSSSFNYFFKKEMTFEQAKIFCSQNILKNIVNLHQKYPLSQEELHLIDQHIKNGIIGHLRKKYPFSDSTEINKRLEQTIREVDNMQALENNYFTKSQIKFEYRESGDYSDLIMRVINDLMKMIDQQKDEHQSNYKQFEELMSSIFQKVQDQDWVKNAIRYNYSLLNELPQQDLHIKNKPESKEKYKNKVKEYTSYLIGRKIPQSTPLYTQKQIENGSINIENSTILRILTKWCEQLQQKYSGSYFSIRSQSLKLQKGKVAKTLLNSMRTAIDRRLSLQKESINLFMKDIFKNNYEMQEKILKNEINLNDSEFIDHIEKVSGKFSYKVVNNLHSYIVAYLNRLIHGLLKTAVDTYYEQNFYKQDSQWTSPPHLISFTIGDLMRCKCSSKEGQIIRLYQEIERNSRQNPQKFKIIRVKNRLKKQTNDILINVRFNNQITCEIQLAIKSKASDFTKCSNSFQHFLYQLQRSIFGPLTELCSIWISLDRRTQTYKQLVKQEYLKKKDKKYKCNSAMMKPYSNPFLCSHCGHSYFHNNYLVNHQKCPLNNCSFIICSNCRIQSFTQEQLQALLIHEQSLKQACKSKVLDNQQIPVFGVCIFIESKEVNYQVFTKIEYLGGKYLLGQKDNNKIYQIYRIDSKQKQKAFKKKFLIFKADQWRNYHKIQQKRALTQYILPLKMKQYYKKYKESINFMNLHINTEQCRKILALGSKSQKQVVKNLYLIDNNINELPFNPLEFPNIKWLNMSNNKIHILKNISKLLQLQRLTLRSCHIQTVDPEVYNCRSLLILNLTNNQVESIDQQIRNLSLLQYLELQQNKITTLPFGLFECRQLRSLNVSKNQLKSVPHGIGNLTKLQSLIYDHNLVTQVSQDIGQLQNLKSLYLEYNKELQTLPQSLQRLTKLQQIDISNTSIKVVPSASWPYLKTLNIQNTFINTLQKDHLTSHYLETLILDNANNVTFPSHFNFKNIEELSVKQIASQEFKNSLTRITNIKKLTIKSDFSQTDFKLGLFTRLQTLVIQFSHLKDVPNLLSCKSILNLDLSNNNIASLSFDRFYTFLPLQEFRCSNNLLTQLPSELIQKTKLSYLDLCYNQFTTLFDKQTEEKVKKQSLAWPSLKYANVSNNCLQQIPLIFCNSKSISKLVLSNNSIGSIRAEVRHMASLMKLELSNNLIQVIPVELQPLKLAKLLLDSNRVAHIPSFIQSFPLAKFLVDESKVKSIDCLDWVLKDSLQQGTNVGKLRELAQRLDTSYKNHQT